MIIWLLILVAAVWVGSRLATLIGFKGTTAIIWSGFVAFTLGIAYELYAESQGICGIIDAVMFLVLVAYFLVRDCRPQPERTDFDEQE